MQSIYGVLYEAAKIDGAGKVKAFFHITMPMMKNVSFVCTILMFIWTINNFENIYLMTQGGPLDSTMILSILTYNSAFFRGQMGYASAINMVMLVFLTILSMIYLKALCYAGNHYFSFKPSFFEYARYSAEAVKGCHDGRAVPV